MTTTTKNMFELINELRRTAFIISFVYFITVIIEIGAIITYSEVFAGLAWAVLIVALGLTTIMYLVIYIKSSGKLNEVILTEVEKEVKRIMKPPQPKPIPVEDES